MLTKILSVSHANRGGALEAEIDLINSLYLNRKEAVVQKISTPTHFTAGKVWREKSTVDFVGVVHSVPIAFDCKETKAKSFPHSNIKPHQFTFLENYEEAGGVGFFLIAFKNENKTFLISVSKLKGFFESQNKKSLSSSDAEKIGKIVKNSDYIKTLFEVKEK